MTDVPTSPARPTRPGSIFAQWFLGSCLGLTILALGAVHAPARIKLLGLFSIAFGMIAGLGMGSLAQSLGLDRSRTLVVVAFVSILAALVGVTVESHRLWAAEEWKAFEASPTAQLATKSLLDPKLPADFKAGLQETIDRQKDALTFRS